MADLSYESIASKIALFKVPGLLVKLGAKRTPEPDSVWSPTSPLDVILGGGIARSPRSPAIHGQSGQRIWDGDQKLGLGLVNSLTDMHLDDNGSKKVLLGLEIRASQPCPGGSGVLNADDDCKIVSKSPKYADSVHAFDVLAGGFSCPMSLDEIAKSEDYTCVVSHGDNPRTTHIFGDCVVVTPGELVGCGEKSGDGRNVRKGTDMLSLCCFCTRELKEGMDVFIYLGEKAFCTPECRAMFIEKEAGDEGGALSSSGPPDNGCLLCLQPIILQ